MKSQLTATFTVLILALNLLFSNSAPAVATPPLTRCNIEVDANKLVKNQKTYAKCENERNSKYFGLAYASATIEGKSKKTLRVMSERTELLKCGN